MALLLASMGGPVVAVETTEVVLRSNPFSAPAKPAPSASSKPAESEAMATPMALHGTLAAGSSSMADIGGEILSLGEEINGYELVEVHDLHVVLQNGQESVTLWIDGYGNSDVGAGGAR